MSKLAASVAMGSILDALQAVSEPGPKTGGPSGSSVNVRHFVVNHDHGAQRVGPEPQIAHRLPRERRLMGLCSEADNLEVVESTSLVGPDLVAM